MGNEIKEKIEDANKKAIDKVLTSNPILVDVKPAIDVVPGMKKNMIMHALAHRSMRIVGAFNKYFKEGKLLNRKSDLDKFLKRIYLALSTLKKDEAKILKKLL